MARSIAIAALLWLACASSAGATPLTSQDVRLLLAYAGFNPGTIRVLGGKGRHILMSVQVTKRRGVFVVKVVEREIR